MPLEPFQLVLQVINLAVPLMGIRQQLPNHCLKSGDIFGKISSWSFEFNHRKALNE
jgi:hypothetical protein